MTFLMQLGQRCGIGLSGLFAVFGSFLSSLGLPRGTPLRGLPHIAQWATLGFLLSKWITVLPPGVLTYFLLHDLERYIGFISLTSEPFLAERF